MRTFSNIQTEQKSIKLVGIAPRYNYLCFLLFSKEGSGSQRVPHGCPDSQTEQKLSLENSRISKENRSLLRQFLEVQIESKYIKN